MDARSMDTDLKYLIDHVSTLETNTSIQNDNAIVAVKRLNLKLKLLRTLLENMTMEDDRYLDTFLDTDYNQEETAEVMRLIKVQVYGDEQEVQRRKFHLTNILKSHKNPYINYNKEERK